MVLVGGLRLLVIKDTPIPASMIKIEVEFPTKRFRKVPSGLLS